MQSRSINVKQTLACSLHEVAKILSSNEEISIGESSGSNSGSNSGSAGGSGSSGSNNNGGAGGGSGSGTVSGSSSNSNSGNNSSSVSIFTGGVSLVEGELIPIFESMLQVSENKTKN